MARPEAPVDHTIPELGELAESLRSLRRKANLTYTELAARTAFSAATLKRAAGGRTLPDAVVAFGYALACEIAPAQSSTNEELRGVFLQWKKARTAVQKTRQAARRSIVMPKPQLVRDEADLSRALRDAWARAGRPSTRAVEKASNGQVPRSTASVIASAHTVPRDFRQYIAYLRVCEIKGQALTSWIRAWFKVRGVPSELQPGLKALHDDGDAQAGYVALYLQATDSALSVAEVLQRLEPPVPDAKKQYSYVRSGPWQEQLRSAIQADPCFSDEVWRSFLMPVLMDSRFTYQRVARAHIEKAQYRVLLDQLHRAVRQA